MKERLPLSIQPQPSETSCGPTCLSAVYDYYEDPVPLDQVMAEVPSLTTGGTLGVMLGNHALRRGYRVTLYTYNLQMFDPTWFAAPETDLADRLRRQQQVKTEARLQEASPAYLEFLDRGGDIRFDDLNSALLRRYLKRGCPVLTGLSITYLYRCAREHPDLSRDDDIAGHPSGHFVVLCGYDKEQRSVRVADPYPNPFSPARDYDVCIDRVIGSILLGILTYDANILIIEPRPTSGP